MSQHISFFAPIAFAASLGVVVSDSSANAAQITGEVKAPGVSLVTRSLGYTTTLIAGASTRLKSQKQDVALYLKAGDDALPLKGSTERREVIIRGLLFQPSVISCVFDEVIVFVNHDRRAVTLTARDKVLGKVSPREEFSYKCEAKGLVPIRLREWKHARGAVFVGTTGVASRPDANGQFTLFAPEGTYELNVIGPSGIIETATVKVVGTEDVNIGLVGAEQPLDETLVGTNEEGEPGVDPDGSTAPPPGPEIPTTLPNTALPPGAGLPKPAGTPASTAVSPTAPPAAAVPAAKPAALPKPAPSKPKPKDDDEGLDDFFDDAADDTPPAKAPAVKPKPAAKPAPPPPPPPKPAAKPKPKPKPKPKAKPKPKPKPKEDEDDDSLDDFFEMEE